MHLSNEHLSSPGARNILPSAYGAFDLDSASHLTHSSQTELPQVGILGSLFWSIPYPDTRHRNSLTSMSCDTCPSSRTHSPTTNPSHRGPQTLTLPFLAGSVFIAGSTAQPRPPDLPFPPSLLALLELFCENTGPTAVAPLGGFGSSSRSCWFPPLPGSACCLCSQLHACTHALVCTE